MWLGLDGYCRHGTGAKAWRQEIAWHTGESPAAVYWFHRVHAGGELVKDKAGERKKPGLRGPRVL